MKDFRIAVGQWPVASELEVNLDRAERFLRAAGAAGARLCVLPEMFQTPYEPDVLRQRGERESGPSVTRIGALAGELGLHVVAGSICEVAGGARGGDAGALHNTAFVFDDHGELLGRHRKIHLFDVDLPGVDMRESDVFTPGERPLVVDTPLCRLGVAVCYDARFPAVFEYFERQGVEVVAVPAAFSQTTGSAHWHVLMRSRAVDYQVWLAAACPAPDPSAHYVAFGHSLVVDPWGVVLAEAGEEAETITADLTAERLADVRRRLPLRQHRRADLYRTW